MEILERARRLATVHDGRTALDDLRDGLPDDVTALRRGLPLVRVQGVRSFYELLEDRSHPHVCTGTACWSARGGAPLPTGTSPVRCLGRCYAAPAGTGGEVDHGVHPIPVRSLVDPPVVFRLVGQAPDLAALYAIPAPADILDRVEASGLRGRGGAAYPTGTKWRAAARQPGPVRYVVVNGDEGDPGSFVDRLLLESAPHAVLAGLNACAAAIGATHGIVFVRGEYPHAAQQVRMALAEAMAAGVLLPGLTVEVKVGAGSYVVGEETALLRAIEGQRGESTPKPPYPAERGLFGKPTVVQNVETISVVPWILATGRKPDTKAFSLSGAVAHPGAVEAPFGITLRELLQRAGGGPAPGRRWKMALVGGPMGTVIPVEHFDVRLGYDTLPGLGHGGVVVLDDTVSAAALAAHLYDFARGESCGNCAPCRIGTAQLAHQRDRESLERLLDTLELGSLCGFGQGVPRPIRDLIAHFPGELFGGAR